MIHSEVPPRVDETPAWRQVVGDFEALYNNEPFWRGVQNLDFDALVREAGFDNVTQGFQLSTPRAVRDARGFQNESAGVMRSWQMISARK